MLQSFTPGHSFNGSAYTSTLTLNSLVLYDMLTPFQIYQGSKLIFTLGLGTIFVDGNLTVTGTLTTNNTIVNTYSSGMIHLAAGNPADSVDIGIYGQYVDGATIYTGLVRDSSDPRKPWVIFNGYTTQPTTVVNGGSPIGDANLDSLKALNYAAVGGSVGSPAYSFTTALDSGMYYSGAAIGFSIAGTQMVVISGGSIVTPNILTISATADSATTTDATASISTLGGLSVAKKINAASLAATSISATSGTINTISNVTFTGTTITAANITSTGVANLSTCNTTALSVTGATTLNTATAVSLTCANLVVTGSATIPGVVSTTGNFTTLTAGTSSLGNTTITGSLNVANPGVNSITGTTNLQTVNGAFGTFTQLRATSSNTSSSANDTNSAVSTAGGLSVAANANIGGNVTIGGNLVVVGSTISVQGTNKITGVENTATVTLDVTKCAVECSFAGTVTVNLPPFSTTYKGKEFYIVSYTGSMLIVPSGADLINGVNASINLGGAAGTKIYILGIESGWWTF